MKVIVVKPMPRMSSPLSLSPLVYVHKTYNLHISSGRAPGQIIGFHGKHICVVEADLFFLPNGGAGLEVSREGSVWADLQALQQGCGKAHGQSSRACSRQGKSFQQTLLGLRWKRCGSWQFKGREHAIRFANILAVELPQYIVESREHLRSRARPASVPTAPASVRRSGVQATSLRALDGPVGVIRANPIGQLQELAQSAKVAQPQYEYQPDSSGFRCRCVFRIEGMVAEGQGTGVSKKAAKKASAVAVLVDLGFKR